MRVSLWIGLVVLVVAAGCADSKETRYKRCMREIERAHKALKEGLMPDKIRDVAAARKALEGKAKVIAEVISSSEVTTFIDENDFRTFAAALREDATKLEEAIQAGHLEDAFGEYLPRVGSDCTLCHNQYRKDGGD